MEPLYHQTNKLVQETQHLCTQLDKRLPNLDVNAVEDDILSKINQINRQVLSTIRFLFFKKKTKIFELIYKISKSIILIFFCYLNFQ